MKVVLLGGNGYLGSLLMNYLCESAFEVKSYDIQNGDDVGNVPQLVKACDGADWVVNLIGPKIDFSQSFPKRATQIANLAVTNAAMAARISETRFLHMSSAHVYGECKTLICEDTTPEPTTLYGRIKLESESLAKQNNPNSILVRLAAVYDEHIRTSIAPSKFGVQSVLNRRLVIEGSGVQTRPFLHKLDFLDGVAKILNSNSKNKIFNLAGKTAISISELATLTESAIGKKVLKERHIARKDDVVFQSIATDRLAGLGWSVKVPIEQGIERVIRQASLSQ